MDSKKQSILLGITTLGALLIVMLNLNPAGIYPTMARAEWISNSDTQIKASIGTPDNYYSLSRMTSEVATTIFVDVRNNTGIEDGTQEHPFNTIQEGLDAATGGDNVQVSAGIYNEKIIMKNGVQLLGAGAELTIIDGTGQNDSVITASNLASETIIDGFTITHGTGKWIGSYTYGGGVHAANSTLIIRNCSFLENTASDGAGGIQTEGSTITIDKCKFINNHGWWGGSITIAGGNGIVQNSLLDSSSNFYGGALFIANGAQVMSVNNIIMHTSSPSPAIGIGNATGVIINNTIANNNGRGIVTNEYIVGGGSTGSAQITNTILWGNNDDLVNLAATYSDIEDADPGQGNISLNPQFSDPANSDFRLLATSPCIDSGNNVEAPLTDFKGDPRPLDGNGDGIKTVDIGTDEYNPLVINKGIVSNSPPGGHLNYTISLVNEDIVNISELVLTDTLPIKTTYQDGSLAASSGDYSYSEGTIKWTGWLDSGNAVTITYTSEVAQDVKIGTPLENRVIVNDEGKLFTRSSITHVDFYHSFLPYVSKARPGIHGRVTANGQPAYGEWLDLRFFDGFNWSTRATTVTNNDGYYSFNNIPGLEPGQIYYVLYDNGYGSPGRIRFWATRDLTSYMGGSPVAIGDFDIADIVLVSPTADTTISLPYTFIWTPRLSVPTDIYEFDLYEPYSYYPWIYTVVGHVGSYSLTGLPSNFNIGQEYVWEIWVYSPDGGFGISSELRIVHFNNLGFPEIIDDVSIKTISASDLESRQGR